MCNPQSAVLGFNIAKSALKSDYKARQGRYQAKRAELEDKEQYKRNLRKIRAERGAARAQAARLGLGASSSAFDGIENSARNARKEQESWLSRRAFDRRMALRQRRNDAWFDIAGQLADGVTDQLLGS